MMKFVLVALMALALPAASAWAQQDVPVDYSSPLVIATADGARHEFMVEVVDSGPARIQGLMFRNSMPPKAGMLFLFPESTERSFWMKNTLIPLDIVFIQGNGVIHHIHEGAKPLDLTPIPSNGPVPVVLELNAGTAKALGIKAGDRVLHPDVANSLATDAGNQ
ncbi:DUF192 domain-containing protein [Micavibrio aeruginosavorus]|uniref:DUF192 domain-containing protein n=1 Tax=Micavibrio aeruginosavorus TaxID=349221 RepID=UPI003F4AC18A